MRYWISATGVSWLESAGVDHPSGFGRWETKSSPVELGVVLTMSDTDIEEGGLVFEENEFTCEAVPTDGIITGFLLRTEPDAAPFSFLPLSPNLGIRVVADPDGEG